MEVSRQSEQVQDRHQTEERPLQIPKHPQTSSTDLMRLSNDSALLARLDAARRSALLIPSAPRCCPRARGSSPPTRSASWSPKSILCYAIVLPGRKLAFPAGFWPDCYRESTARDELAGSPKEGAGRAGTWGEMRTSARSKQHTGESQGSGHGQHVTEAIWLKAAEQQLQSTFISRAPRQKHQVR